MNIPIVTRGRFGIVYRLAILATGIFFITRLALLLSFAHTMDAGLWPVVASFFIGLLYDVVVASFIILPLILQLTFTNNYIYTRQGRWVSIAFFLLCIVLYLFTSIVPKDFNRSLYTAFIFYLFFRLGIYIILLFAGDTWVKRWRIVSLNFLIGLTIFCLLFNAMSEWFFWDEFSSRYNFIAVDYLVYTNEVLGNIQESYPIFWIIAAVLVITLVLLWLLRRMIIASVVAPMSFIKRLVVAILLLLLPITFAFVIKPQWKNFSTNNYANELAGNGIYDFVQAFQDNQLDFYRYYKTIPDAEAFRIVRQSLAAPNTTFTSDSFSIERTIHYDTPAINMNVVLISVESLSASFMHAFGNTANLTPNLDSLAAKALLFTNTYASGTRTVRGLEALALSIPPTPGQSLVKRPNNENLFSLGHVFATKGYTTQYMYGGYGYFDNMNYFFSNNGYATIDRSAIDPVNIHYANIWGVADEDLFTLALHTMDANAAMGKPFFTQVMTVSNHKPYTYPAGRIDMPTGSREGAVKYTDYAIGDFIKKASTKPWFSNTLFVIVADHCASSAGSTALPVTGYHIPLLMYAPALLQPKKITTLTAQTDIAPTILGLLHTSYTSKFFGQDVLNTSDEQRHAFISTYQGLGFLQQDHLVLQSPKQQVKTYKPDFVTGKNVLIPNDSNETKRAIAWYQVAAWMIKNGKLKVE